MKYLHYPLYRRGRCGLSNLLMSAEVGVVASFLLERVLVLEDNCTPVANVVKYPDHGLTNRHRSRITDLIELPVPWTEAGQVDYDPAGALVLGEGRVMSAVFYWPPDTDLSSGDFRSFARGRGNLLTETRTSQAAQVARLFPCSPDGQSMENFGFYSYFFYLDAPTRRAVDALLRRMRPKDPYAELAARVGAGLGSFNAVHVRRGDFKQTIGVTTRDREPVEVIRVLDESFARDEALVILTDEREDPFFDEITAHFPRSIFLDHHVLERHRDEFFDLPQHDSIALAFLCQLVAADSLDFVGTMTSTYTSMIQRYRGSRGKSEPFKFLWNELPEPDVASARRGSHPPSDCVPLHADGRLVEQHAGPYAWNRYNPLINPAWQREWPESFLEDFAGGTEEADALLAPFREKRHSRGAGRDGAPGSLPRVGAPTDLETDHVCVVRNSVYRLGDIVLERDPRGRRSQEDVRAILTDDAYRNTILRRYLEEEQRRGLGAAKEVTDRHLAILRRVTKEHILRHGLASPGRDELVFHIQIGDEEQPGHGNEREYLGIIHKARLLFDIDEVTIVTAISLDRPDGSVADAERREADAIRYLGGLFDAMLHEFPDLRFGLKSSDDVDEDFCYLTGAKYLVPSGGSFSKLAARMLDPDSRVFVGVGDEPATLDPEHG